MIRAFYFMSKALKVTLKAFDNFKNKQKKSMKSCFLIKVYIF